MKSIKKLKRDADMLYRTLTPVPGEDHVYTIPLKVSGYFDLTCIIADIIKACVLADNIGEPQISPLTGSGKINIGNLLELALQLMPYDEAEFLDDARAVLQPKRTYIEPQWNYSTIRVIEEGIS